MKILITGSNGLLGQKLVYKLKERKDVEVIATARGENRLVDKDGYTYESLDISDYENTKSIFAKHKPDAIINSAAMTNVDACEVDKDAALLLNATAVEYQVKVLEELQNEDYKPHYIHLSTDFIFDGSLGPLTEDEDPNPLRQKARGLAMEDALSRAEILADASGIEVGKPISIQELSYGGPVVKSENLAGISEN